MTTKHFRLALAAIAMSAAAPTLAQTIDPQATGVYGVARAGVTVDTDARLKAADVRAPATIQQETDYNRGFTGEIGVGYDTGPVRI